MFERLPAVLQPPVRVARIATARGGMPARARIRLLRVVPRLISRRQRTEDVPVPLPSGTVFLGGESLFVDAKTLGYVWSERVFAAECAGRLVVDLGAHKGYFAAWALANGAAHVHSVEPEAGNFARLDKARRMSAHSRHWSVRRAAVGDSNRTVSLFVSSESWAHSIQDGMVDAISEQSVSMLPLAEVLEDLKSEHGDVDVVLKVNVEGSVGSILLPTSSADLQRVVEIHLDHEPGSPYDLEAVLAHLAEAGLDRVDRVREKIFVIRRSRDSA
jgi:FkbM family methyltransferase